MRNATGSESWCTVLKNEGSTAVAPANVFVSWALTVELDELITALNDYVAAQGLDPSSTYFWIFELYHTADGGAKFEILMSQEQRNRFLKAVERDFGG